MSFYKVAMTKYSRNNIRAANKTNSEIKGYIIINLKHISKHFYSPNSEPIMFSFFSRKSDKL